MMSIDRSAEPSPFRQLLHFFLRQQPWWIGLLIWLVAAPAQAALELRVAVEQDANQVQVGSSTDAVLKDVGTGREIPGGSALGGAERRRLCVCGR
jgi:stage II sporulation protein D